MGDTIAFCPPLIIKEGRNRSDVRTFRIRARGYARTLACSVHTHVNEFCIRKSANTARKSACATIIKREARGQLDLSRACAFGLLHGSDLSEAGRNCNGQIAGRRIVRMVRNVRYLRAEFRPNGLGERNSLEQRERNNFGPGAHYRALRGVAETANIVWRVRERGGIDPLVYGLAHVGTNSGDGVCAAPGREQLVVTGTGRIIVSTHRQEGTALEKRQTTENPAAQNHVRRAIYTIHESLAFAERQFIIDTRQEAVAAVKGRVAVVESGMIGIAEFVAKLVRKTLGRRIGRSDDIRKVARVRVTRLELKAVGPFVNRYRA